MVGKAPVTPTTSGTIERSTGHWTIYADVCHSTRPEGKQPDLFLAEVIANDWVYRQLRTYEYGGLRAFVERTAASGSGLAPSG